jgi:ubiquinone biosynthesis monooxygenase Coq6
MNPDHDLWSIGSHTALLPYARGRYFENHKLMAAIDKLHKIYSSTFKPLVWARSVGVEVLNELDSVKAAMMIVAGAVPGRPTSDSRGPSVDASGWALAARGVEGLASGMTAAKLLGNGIAAAFESSVRGMLKPRPRDQTK